MAEVLGVLWVAVTAYAVWSARDVAHRWLTLSHPAPEGGAEDVELPEDIEALAACESELWAQEEIRKTAIERYMLLDGKLTEEARWNLVRKAIGIGQR